MKINVAFFNLNDYNLFITKLIEDYQLKLINSREIIDGDENVISPFSTPYFIILGKSIHLKNLSQYCAKQKLLNYDAFLKIGTGLANYIDQFYELNENHCDSQDIMQKFIVETHKEKNERLEQLNYPFIVTPAFTCPINQTWLPIIHSQIIKILMDLKKLKVTNVYVRPPYKNGLDDYIEEEMSVRSEAAEMDGNYWDESGNDEEQSMNDETDGFWGWENEYN